MTKGQGTQKVITPKIKPKDFVSLLKGEEFWYKQKLIYPRFKRRVKISTTLYKVTHKILFF